MFYLDDKVLPLKISSVTLILFVILLFQAGLPIFNIMQAVQATKSNVTVAAVGDWGCNSNTSKTIANIVKSNPALVIGLGDNSYEPRGDCWLNIIKPLSAKIHTAFGNHDGSPALVTQYLEYFKLVKTYYSFDFENIHFVTIDTNAPLDFNSEQFKFVKTDLEKASSNKSINWIIPFFHIPAYTTPSGERIGTSNPTEHATITSFETLRNIYQPLFDKYGINIVLQAHAHNYQRTYPISYNSSSPANPIIMTTNRNNYNSPTGEIYLTVGTGGRDLHEFVGPSPVYVITKQDTLHGFLSLEFTDNGSSVTGRFYSNDKIVTIDEFTIAK
jgi:Calcineurin-like phosphoesterase